MTGAVLSLLALVGSGFGSLLVHANFHSKEPLTSTSQKVSDAVGSTTGHVVAALFAIPFLIAGIVLAILAVIFIVRRLPKVKITGLLTSIIWLLVSIWAFIIATNAFNLLKAHS